MMQTRFSKISGTKPGSSHARRDHVYAKLKADLIDFRFRPGEHLSISKLCTDLKVSNTPVREALIHLSAERLVRIEPAQGFFARDLRLKDMRDLLDLAQSLLRSCVNSGILPFPLDRVERPAALGFQSVARASRVLQSNPEETAIFIESILQGIACMSDNGAVIDVVENVCERTRFVRVWEIRQSRGKQSLAIRFVALLDALERGDMNSAASIIDRCYQTQAHGLPNAVAKALASIFMHDQG